MHLTVLDTPVVNTVLRVVSRLILRLAGWRVERTRRHSLVATSAAALKHDMAAIKAFYAPFTGHHAQQFDARA